MKQTNNAIKFLMAQYRAIFQNAYFKGLATAAVVTMGLAAGQAQAQDTAIATLTGDQSFDSSTTFEITASATANDALTSINITAGDSHSIKGAATDGTTVTAKKTNLTIEGTGKASDTKLTVAGQSKTDAAATLVVKDLAVKNGTLDLTTDTNAATVEAESITVGKEATQSTPVTIADGDPTAVISVAADSTLGKATTAYTLYKGGQITLAGDAAKLLGKSLKSDGGKLVVKGNVDFVTPTVGAEKLNINVDADKTLTVKLPANGTERGVAHFASGSTINLASASATKGTLAISGDTTSGSLVILDSGVNLTSTGDDLATGGVITVTGVKATDLGTAELQTDADVLGKFLVGSTDEPKAAKGGVTLAANSKLTINNKAVVLGVDTTALSNEKLDLALNASAAAGKVAVTDATTIAADNLSVVKNLTGMDSHLSLVANTLTLGSAEFDSSKTTPFGFKSATAKNVNFISSGSATLKLQDAVTLKNTDEDEATINGSVTLGTDQKDLTITQGKYKYEAGNTMTIGSGDLVINSTTADNNSETTLSFEGDLKLDNTDNASSTGGISLTGAANKSVSLDLTKANISFVEGTTARSVTFAAGANSTLSITGAQAKQLILDNASTKAGVFTITAGGKLNIDGDLTLSNAAAQLKKENITTNGINLTSGTVAVTGTAQLLDSDEIDLGATAAADAKFQAQELRIKNADPEQATTLKSGSFVVTKSLVTSGKSFALADHGVIELGTLTEKTPEGATAYWVADGSGSVNKDISINANGAKVAVNTGNWTATGVTIKQNESLVVGMDATERKDKDGNVITTKLTLDKLATELGTTTDTATTVNKNATLVVGEVDLSRGVADVKGTLVLNGKAFSGEGDPANGNAKFGLNFQKDAVKLGEGAVLSLQDQVHDALGLGEVKSGDTVTANGFTPNTDVFKDTGFVSGGAFSKVELNLEGVAFETDALTKLQSALFGTAGTSGTISLGQGSTIADLNDLYEEGTVESGAPVLKWEDVESNDVLLDVLPGVEDETLMKAQVVVKDQGPVLGHLGSIKSEGAFAGQSINVNNNGSLNNAFGANKQFAYNKDGELLGLDIAEKVNFALNNGGKVGEVSLGDSTKLVVNGGAAKADTTIASVDGSAAALSVKNGKLDVTETLNIGTLATEQGSALVVGGAATIKEAALEGVSEFKNTLVANDKFTSTGELTVTKSAQFKGDVTLSGKNTFQDTVSFATGYTNKITEGFTSAKEIKLADSSTSLYIGTEAVTEGANTTNGTSATVVTEKLSLGGGSLFVDPDYVVNSSIFVTNELTGATNADSDNKTDAGTLTGDAIVLQNSIFAVGVDSEAKVKAALAPLFNANGALDKENNKIGAVAYVAKSITLGTGDNLIVDSARGLTAYNDDKANNTAYQSAIGNAIYLGTNSALAVDGTAFDGSKAPITLQDNSKVYVGDNAKVILTGSNVVNKARGNKLFDGNNLGIAAPSTVQNPTLTVETINGWFTQDLTSLDAKLTLGISRTKVDADLEVVSAPVKDTLLTVAYCQKNYDDSTAKPIPVYGELAEGIVQDADGKFYIGKKNAAGDNKVTDKALLDRLANATVTDNGAVIYFAPENELIDNIVYNNGSAVDAETNARLAVFGGAPQAAIEAGASTYEAISARMGVGVSGVSAAANGQGGAIWVTPVYKSADADGFNADNKSYGADVKLYGLALGADIEVAPNFKVGGMFNVGSGDADGQGLGSNVSNDFDYYGLGLYAGYSMDAFSLVADVTYTAVDNDIEGNTDLGKVNASIDSTNLSVGVTGQYKLSVAGMDVTPHAGLRFSMLDMDDYSTAYSQNDSDSLNIFSVPVGVTIAKEYVTDTWTVKPSFDLTLTGNFGDDEVDATAKWYGFHDLSTNVKSEIMDNFTYGAAVGVSATSGNFGLGLGVNYTGSSNTDEFGVNANARYMF